MSCARSGDLDVVFGNLRHPPELFQNNGHGVFTVVPTAFSANTAHCMGLVIGDLNGDGRLDIMFNYENSIGGASGTDDPLTNRLQIYWTGTGAAYVAATDTPIDDVVGYTRAMITGDVNNDGIQDVFIANGCPNSKTTACFYGVTPGANRLLLGQPGGAFTEVAAGSGSPGLDKTRPSLCAAFADYDQDGWLDLAVCGAASYISGTEQFPLTELYRNTGNGQFEEIALTSLVARSTYSGSQSTWAMAWGDADNEYATGASNRRQRRPPCPYPALRVSLDQWLARPCHDNGVLPQRPRWHDERRRQPRLH